MYATFRRVRWMLESNSDAQVRIAKRDESMRPTAGSQGFSPRVRVGRCGKNRVVYDISSKLPGTTEQE
jgi:GMP synthase PP-ATPase subunit